jgi:hypothetical protein
MTATELEQSLRLILSLEYLSLYIGEEESMLYADWKRQPTREELQHGFTLIVGQLIAYNLKFWLGNFSLIHLLDEEDQKWYAEQLVTDLRFTKLQKVARVVSGSYHSYQTAANLMRLANENPITKSKIEHQVFMSFSSALAWFNIAQRQQ